MPRHADAPTGSMFRWNHILAAVPHAELRQFEDRLDVVSLPARTVLHEADEPVHHIHFLHGGIVSLATAGMTGEAADVAMVGPEGIVGVPLVLGADRMSCSATMQIGGTGVRLSARALREVLPRCPELHRLLMRYALSLMTQIAHNAACARLHGVDARLACCLLTIQDRLQDDSFLITQEALAEALGARRPTISGAAGLLARSGAIAYVRGRMTIVDRGRLQQASCGCHRLYARDAEIFAAVGA